MKNTNAIILMAAVLMLSACANQAPNVSSKATTVAPPLVPAGVNKVEAEISRITAKLETQPTIKGWNLVGDAYMHLKQYEKAVDAYRQAHEIAGFEDVATKSKLRTALYNYARYGRPSGSKAVE